MTEVVQATANSVIITPLNLVPLAMRSVLPGTMCLTRVGFGPAMFMLLLCCGLCRRFVFQVPTDESFLPPIAELDCTTGHVEAGVTVAGVA